MPKRLMPMPSFPEMLAAVCAARSERQLAIVVAAAATVAAAAVKAVAVAVAMAAAAVLMAHAAVTVAAVAAAVAARAAAAAPHWQVWRQWRHRWPRQP